MALRFNGSVEQGVIVQTNVGSNYTNTATIFVQTNAVDENNIRLIGSLYYYKQFSNSDFTQWFAVGQCDVRQPRTAYRIGFTANTNDIIRYVPLYDFASVGIWINNATY